MPRPIKRIFMTLPVLMTLVFLPLDSFSSEVVKIRHMASLYSDKEEVSMKYPEGIACSEDHSLVVADTGNSRLLQYTLQDGTLQEEATIRISQLPYPIRVQINSRKEIYALDGKEKRIVHLGPKGEFRGYLEPVGLPAPAAYVPRAFYIDRDDNFYIIDIFSERVILLGPDGKFQKSIKFPENYGFFSDITVDFKGTILLIDSVKAKVFSSDRSLALFIPLTESLKKYTRFPTNISTDNRGRIYLVDHNGSLIAVIGQDGSYLGQLSGMGWKDGLLNYPSQLCINSNDEIFITDTNNSRVQVFKLIR